MTTFHTNNLAQNSSFTSDWSKESFIWVGNISFVQESNLINVNTHLFQVMHKRFQESV